MKRVLILLLIGLTGCIQTDLQGPLPEAIRIINTGQTIWSTDSYVFEVEFSDRDGVLAIVEPGWFSSDESILEFDGQEAISKSAGTVEITATYNDLTTSASITIEPSQEQVTITMFKNQMTVNEVFTFNINYLSVEGENVSVNPTWSSSMESVASIDQNGTVTAHLAGMTTINVSAGNVHADLNLEVIQGDVMVDPEIRFTVFDDELEMGDSFQFKASYFGTDGNVDTGIPISWSSDDPSILSIDNTGLANALAVGLTMITASGGGLQATKMIEVKEANIVRTGTLGGAGGYDVSGDFTGQLNDEDELIMNVEMYVSDGPWTLFLSYK